MTYTVMDQQGRHASEKMDTDVVEASDVRVVRVCEGAGRVRRGTGVLFGGFGTLEVDELERRSLGVNCRAGPVLQSCRGRGRLVGPGTGQRKW